MADRLRRRSPSNGRTWVDEAAGVTLRHRRLSILDLSATGHQPMISGSDRYAVSFNGEIHNFDDLRKELEAKGQGFRGHSDTEEMLAAFEIWDVLVTAGSLIGGLKFSGRKYQA